MRTILFLSLIPLIWATTVSNVSEDVQTAEERDWRSKAVRKLWTERLNMGHTRLDKVEIPGVPLANIFVKVETDSASGTLKHRFVWALTLWGVVERKIKANTTVYDSTSGNTGASEAYMCRLIGVPYVAVVAKELEEEKVRQITQFGGTVKKVDVEKRNYWAEKLAADNGGFFINQFGNADAAEEYHESGNYEWESTNVFHEIARQFEAMNRSSPDYFVHSAGTGGTISSVGKYITRYSLPTKVVMADSQFSLFYDYVVSNKYFNVSAGEAGRPAWVSPGVAGIGYGYNTAPIIYKNTTSLLRTVVDEVARMPDMATVAAMRSLQGLRIDAGASTALNFLVSLYKAIDHQEEQRAIGGLNQTSLVFIMGDPGKFYRSTYLNDTWINTKMARFGGMKALNCWKSNIDLSITNGTDFLTTGAECDV